MCHCAQDSGNMEEYLNTVKLSFILNERSVDLSYNQDLQILGHDTYSGPNSVRNKRGTMLKHGETDLKITL